MSTPLTEEEKQEFEDRVASELESLIIAYSKHGNLSRLVIDAYQAGIEKARKILVATEGQNEQNN